MASPSRPLLTAEDLYELPDHGGRTELVHGEPFDMSHSSLNSSQIGLIIASAVLGFVRPRRLGVVTGELAGFILARNPDTVRAPDVAFVRADRITSPEQLDFFFEGSPDLAVEVLSPTDRLRVVRAKCLAYLDAGVRLVWLVEPNARRVTVYFPDRSTRAFGAGDTLDGGDVLPGFALALSDLFD